MQPNNNLPSSSDTVVRHSLLNLCDDDVGRSYQELIRKNIAAGATGLAHAAVPSQGIPIKVCSGNTSTDERMTFQNDNQASMSDYPMLQTKCEGIRTTSKNG